MERYRVEYVVHNNKPSGGKAKMRLLGRWVTALGERPVNAITEADVLKFKDDVLNGRTNGRSEADHLIGALRHMFAWAKQRRSVAADPAADITKEWKYVPGRRPPAR